MGTRFSAPVQTSPGAHPASYAMGTRSFTGVKRPGRGVDHPHPSSSEVKERVELYLYSPSGPSWSVLGRTLPLPLLEDTSVFTSCLHLCFALVRYSLYFVIHGVTVRCRSFVSFWPAGTPTAGLGLSETPPPARAHRLKIFYTRFVLMCKTRKEQNKCFDFRSDLL